jgi:dolichol-phosphate mannosyltransferase
MLKNSVKSVFSRQFLKFAVVGFTGTLIHLLVLFVLTEFFGIYYIISSIIAFFFAVTNNFFLNKLWTFGYKDNRKFFMKYSQFLIISILALVVNVFILFTFTEFFKIYYLFSQIIAILFSLWINFFGNKIWTFRK